MNPKTVNILRSPYSHEPLLLSETADGRPCLRSSESATIYPIQSGIANLLIQDRLEGTNRKYQRFYNLIAPLYDGTLQLGAKLARDTVAKVRQQYIAKLELSPGCRFLEVSIGTADNIKHIPEGVDCYGIDISTGMLKRAQRKLAAEQREVELLLADAEELPFQDRVFDSLLHVGGINAFNDRARALQEMVRVCKPGSTIVVVDETIKLMQRLSWLPGANRMLRKYSERFEPPVDLLPQNVTAVEVIELVGGALYCLSFRTT